MGPFLSAVSTWALSTFGSPKVVARTSPGMLLISVTRHPGISAWRRETTPELFSGSKIHRQVTTLDLYQLPRKDWI